MSDDEISELTETERERWRAAQDSIQQFAYATLYGDTEGAAALQGQMRSIDIDLARIRDSLHGPEDAGEYAFALETILRRIPDGWGRWISCPAGWYPLIVVLDRQLAQLDPDYEVHQVKKKYGTLRFYAEPSNDSVDREEFDRLIDETEKRSESAREQCGALGMLCVSDRRVVRDALPPPPDRSRQHRPLRAG
ncbi:MAG: hypothetical protein QM607_02735 [Microbacterium sp.]